MKINTCYLQRGKESQHRVTYFPRLAFNLFFLRLFSLLIHILLVGILSVLFVCFTFLLLFSNKMKSSFLFYDGTEHTDKYRMNDVTMIYK